MRLCANPLCYCSCCLRPQWHSNNKRSLLHLSHRPKHRKPQSPPDPYCRCIALCAGVGLDPQRVFKIREAEIDREDVHIWLNDGTIAFTQAVDGQVTGAYFEGEGEVLMRPPDRMERASLGLFINAGVLEEKFSSGYLRFNDDTAKELEPFLRPPEDAADFVARNDGTARNPRRDRRHAALHFVYQRAGSRRSRASRRPFPIACCTPALPASTTASSMFSSTPAVPSRSSWATLRRMRTRSITTCG